MLTIKKSPFRMGGLACALVLAGLLVSCTPSGPRALEQGSKLIQQGKYSAAVRKLRIATSKRPQDALAWNHLGLAYHKLGETNQALAAYQKAVKLDSNLAAVYYNLGALYFEQSNYPEAIRALGTYVRLQPESANGWLELGIVQRHAGILNEAQQSFNQAESLDPSNAQLFNEMGLLQLESKRPDLAMQSFARAVNLNTNYAPAVLNLAVVAHRYTTNLNYALGRYREYLAIKPTPPSAEEVAGIVANLEQKIASLEKAQSAVPAETEPVEAEGEVAEATSREPASQPKIELNLPPSTNLLAAASNPVVPRVLKETRSDPLAGLILTASLKPAPIPPPGDDIQPEPLPLKTNLIEIDEAVIKQESLREERERNALPPGVTPLEPITEETPERTADQERTSFLQRMNPGRWFRSRETRTTAATEPSQTASLPQTPARSQTGDVSDAETKPPDLTASEEASKPESERVFPRYAYQEWSPPAPGSRARAQTYFAEGFQAQRRKQYDTAIEQYRIAIRWDPSYYEAYYNMGICALLAGDYSRALDSFERALVIQPDSRAARYNFALALQRANYPLDAVEVFQAVLAEDPADARVHLALANLYAQVLDQPDRARQHYSKVLEIDPDHPQATAIRYWLQRHPEEE